VVRIAAGSKNGLTQKPSYETWSELLPGKPLFHPNTMLVRKKDVTLLGTGIVAISDQPCPPGAERPAAVLPEG